MIIKPEARITLDAFKPRDYQRKSCVAFESGQYTKFIDIEPRRSGKDFKWWNLMVRQAFKRVGLYLYCLPTFSQARSVIWEGKTNTGLNFIDSVPKQLITKIRNDTMTINLLNGSIIRLIGSDAYNTSIVGSNPIGIVFSEYALCDENAYKLAALPILRANGGWCALISTPRGKNHLYELYQIAKNSDDWYTEFLTVEDTGHISLHEIKREIESGEISEDLAMQEYWCSFEMGQEGSYYAKYLDKMKLQGRITTVTWEPYHPVYTAWDLGIKDPTVIIFFQVIGDTVRIFDYYEAADKPMSHFAQYIQNKKDEGYLFQYHFGPHDLMQRESARGLTKRELYAELGVKFAEPIFVEIEDGIELVRKSCTRIWIDEVKCKKLIKALENYREEYDVKRRVYRGRPLHDWSSHACFVADTLILTRTGMRQIIDIKENDEVMTMHGWQKCSKAFKTKLNATLVEVRFTDGTVVRCTPEHLFLTTKREWKSAQYLKKGTVIQSNLVWTRSCLRDVLIEYGMASVIFQECMANGYTEMFGAKHLEQSHQAVTYIIKTITDITMPYGIWNVFQQENIFLFLNQMVKVFRKKLEKRLMNGIDLRKEYPGIGSMLKELRHGLSSKEKTNLVNFVTKTLNVLFEKMGMDKSSVTQTVKLPKVESVRELQEKADVYDITVPAVGNFSLSNGAIVHNSDAMRYLCAALPKVGKKTSPEDLEKRYREAYYGEQSNMPAVFQDHNEYY